MPRDRSPPPPLDHAATERLALRYVERFATSRGKLTAYLNRKLRERGMTGVVDGAAIAGRMAELGYVDDRAFAEARAGAMTRRGLGARRVTQDLRHAAIDPDAIAAIVQEVPAVAAALAYARRRRIGPFASVTPDRAERDRQIAALVRAGHDYRLARAITHTPPGEDFADWD